MNPGKEKKEICGFLSYDLNYSFWEITIKTKKHLNFFVSVIYTYLSNCRGDTSAL